MDGTDSWQQPDELADDLFLLTIALLRTHADSGRRYRLDDVLTEAGIGPGSRNAE